MWKLKNSLVKLKISILVGVITIFATGLSYAQPLYSVNLFWVNHDLRDEQQYIYPNNDVAIVNNKLISPVVKWAELGNKDDSVVNLWFDSLYTPVQAIENTKLLLDEAMHGKVSAPIFLRDIRDLPEVQSNAFAFSNQAPVYFRADLARVVASIYDIEKKNVKFWVYADLDVTPLTAAELFDIETLAKLDKYNIVMTDGGCNSGNFENSFFIIKEGNANFDKAMQTMLVDLNIIRMKNLFNDPENFYTYRRPRVNAFAQMVYDTYQEMFAYFYHLEGYSKLEIKNHITGPAETDAWGRKMYPIIDCQLEPYTISEHGLKHFGPNADSRPYDSWTIDTNPWDIGIPKKKIAKPAPSYDYIKPWPSDSSFF